MTWDAFRRRCDRCPVVRLFFRSSTGRLVRSPVFVLTPGSDPACSIRVEALSLRVTEMAFGVEIDGSVALKRVRGFGESPPRRPRRTVSNIACARLRDAVSFTRVPLAFDLFLAYSSTVSGPIL